LFKGEKNGNNFRQYISNPTNFKTHGNNFGDLMKGALEMLDSKENKEQILDTKPPCD
jgi:hypothetical protein